MQGGLHPLIASRYERGEPRASDNARYTVSRAVSECFHARRYGYIGTDTLVSGRAEDLFVDVRTISEICCECSRMCISLSSGKFRENFVINLHQIRVYVLGEREHVSRRGGRGLRFFVFCRLPSPLLVPFCCFLFRPSNLGLFVVPLQTPAPGKKMG